jgi:hypothetical protein
MGRPLDDLAEALHAANGPRRQRLVVCSDQLFRQFGLPITPSRWAECARQLRCVLPPLSRSPYGLWSFPCGWETVWDLTHYLSETHPGWQSPEAASVADWVEAQVFVGVRETLMEALNVDKSRVMRSARLVADLGAE